MSNDPSEKTISSHTYRFNVEGMTCAACVATVEGAMQKVAGVQEVSVNLATESATVSSAQPIPVKRFSQAVSKMGYKLEPQGSTTLVDRQERNVATWRRLLNIQAFFGIPLLIYAMTEMMVDTPMLTMKLNFALQFILASILVGSGYKYYQRGIKHLLMRVPNMDTLVALGTGAAFLYSLVSALNLSLAWELNGFQTLYFEAAGTILLFITFGKWLEAVARGKTTEALTGLVGRMPTEALVRKDNNWVTRPLAEVVIGDEVKVNPHTKIPVDGIVIEGHGSVDESAISGEALPVEKHLHSPVIGASQNLQHVLIIKAEKIGKDSMFGQVIELVEKAQGEKPKIQKSVDQISAIFVPVVLSLAILSGLTWLFMGYGLTFAMNVMISVLIIACPCALGLATPTALVVGSGLAARGGILVKSADAFQSFSKVDLMVFDKTGTVTESRPKVIETFPGDSETVMEIAMGLEMHSQHPLADALMKFGTERSIQALQFSEIQEVPGQGLFGVRDGSQASIRKISSAGGMPVEFKQVFTGYESSGYMVSGVYREDDLLGLVAFADSIKAESQTVMGSLADLNIQTRLLSGDKETATEQVAKAVGIESYEAEVLPADKHAYIQRLRDQGKVVAMLGDGINDAPALVAADVGLSFAGSTDIAVNAADIIFMNNSLHNLIFAHRISQATISKIHQNLFWAFIYNLAGIPIAMGVLYPLTGTLLNPIFAGMAMAFSSVSVVTNTLFLRHRDYFKRI